MKHSRAERLRVDTVWESLVWGEGQCRAARKLESRATWEKRGQKKREMPSHWKEQTSFWCMALGSKTHRWLSHMKQISISTVTFSHIYCMAMWWEDNRSDNTAYLSHRWGRLLSDQYATPAGPCQHQQTLGVEWEGINWRWAGDNQGLTMA